MESSENNFSEENKKTSFLGKVKAFFFSTGDNEKDPEKRRKENKYLRILWLLFALPFLFLFIVFFLISTGNMGFMPTFEELENPKRNLASEIISSDNTLLGKYYQENRTIVTFEDISPYLVNSLIATEDIRFHKHSGIDGKALLRVAYGVLTGNRRGGGSTVTQQLAKNLFPRDTTIYTNKISFMWNMMITKFKEWVTAVKLEKKYTKQEIIVMYLNTVPFGSGAYGIKSAARTFFNTSSDSLKIQEAALLVGVLKAPTRYSPVLNPENSVARRNTVLSQMEKYDFISPQEYDSLSNMPIELDYNVRSHNEGLSTYFREYLRTTLGANKPKREHYASWQYQKYVQDSIEWETNPMYGWCNKHFSPDGKPYNLYKDGLKIYTTINAKMQKYAEGAVAQHLAGYLQPMFFKKKANQKKAPFTWRLTQDEIDQIIYRAIRRSERYRVLRNMGLDSAEIRENFKKPTRMRVFRWKKVEEDKIPDVWSEEVDTVMAPVDSILYYKHYLRAGFMSFEPHTGYVRAYVGGINYRHFKYDHVKLSRRQVGSTFKPFVYTLAMIDGLSPCYKIANVAYSIEMPDDQPVYTPRFSHSKFDGKKITIKRGLSLSLNQISAWIMRRYTPQSVIDITRKMGVRSPIDPVPSICVGAAEVTLYEMVGAYGSYANKGVYTEPIFVTRIEDRNGNIITRFAPSKNQAINEETAYLMLHLMQGVVNSGTASRLRYKYGLKNQIAGKTGTTNDNADGWFIGITPKLISGAWVGGEERSIRFASGYLGQGSSMALPIWALYMKKVYNDPSLIYSTDDRFQEPNFELSTEIDCSKYNQESDKMKRDNIIYSDEIY